jgi:hypothetical protein
LTGFVDLIEVIAGKSKFSTVAPGYGSCKSSMHAVFGVPTTGIDSEGVDSVERLKWYPSGICHFPRPVFMVQVLRGGEGR